MWWIIFILLVGCIIALCWWKRQQEYIWQQEYKRFMQPAKASNAPAVSKEAQSSEPKASHRPFKPRLMNLSNVPLVGFWYLRLKVRRALKRNNAASRVTRSISVPAPIDEQEPATDSEAAIPITEIFGPPLDTSLQTVNSTITDDGDPLSIVADSVESAPVEQHLISPTVEVFTEMTPSELQSTEEQQIPADIIETSVASEPVASEPVMPEQTKTTTPPPNLEVITLEEATRRLDQHNLLVVPPPKPEMPAVQEITPDDPTVMRVRLQTQTEREVLRQIPRPITLKTMESVLMDRKMAVVKRRPPNALGVQGSKVIGEDDIRANLLLQRIARRREQNNEGKKESNIPPKTVIAEQEILANLAHSDSPVNKNKFQRTTIRDSVIPAAARVDKGMAMKLNPLSTNYTEPVSSLMHSPAHSGASSLSTRFTPFHPQVANSPKSASPLLAEQPINKAKVSAKLHPMMGVSPDIVGTNFNHAGLMNSNQIAETDQSPLWNQAPMHGLSNGINTLTSQLESDDNDIDPSAPLLYSQPITSTTTISPMSGYSYNYGQIAPVTAVSTGPLSWQEYMHMDQPEEPAEEPHLYQPDQQDNESNKTVDLLDHQPTSSVKVQLRSPDNLHSAQFATAAKNWISNQKMSKPISDEQFSKPKISVSASVISTYRPKSDQSNLTNILNQTMSRSLDRSDEPEYEKRTVILPDIELLLPAEDDPSAHLSEEALLDNGIIIEEKLAEFKVKVKVVEAFAGPVITRYEIEPAQGVRGSQVVNLEKDLARSLGFAAIRVVETIPGKTCMGLELPNPKRQMIHVREIFTAEVFQQSHSQLTLALGQDITGQPVVTDLAKAPHLLVAGTTGSGKSVGVNAMILSLLFKATPEQVRLIMIDPKMLELSIYEGIPHLLAPVVTDMKLAANALSWCVNEMEKRYRLMSFAGVRNIIGFNQKIIQAEISGQKLTNPFSLTPDDPEPLQKLPFIVVVVDEFADLMMTAGKKIEELIARLAQKARAAGIHLILATQRPSVDVITGLIKANIPTRIAFQVSSKIDSRTILDQMGAENLLGQGDMLFLPPGTAYPQRIHGAFVADEEVHRVVDYLKQFGEPDYIDDVLMSHNDDIVDSHRSNEDEQDPLYDEAVSIVVKTRKASISSVQRQLRIGYNRAARMVEQMEMDGIVSSPENNGSRTVLAPNNNHLED